MSRVLILSYKLKQMTYSYVLHNCFEIQRIATISWTRCRIVIWYGSTCRIWYVQVDYWKLKIEYCRQVTHFPWFKTKCIQGVCVASRCYIAPDYANYDCQCYPGCDGTHCCGNLQTVCSGCFGRCGNYDSTQSCQCDSLCGSYGDCCGDYSLKCIGNVLLYYRKLFFIFYFSQNDRGCPGGAFKET